MAAPVAADAAEFRGFDTEVAGAAGRDTNQRYCRDQRRSTMHHGEPWSRQSQPFVYAAAESQPGNHALGRHGAKPFAPEPQHFSALTRTCCPTSASYSTHGSRRQFNNDHFAADFTQSATVFSFGFAK